MIGMGSLRGGLTTRAEHCKESFFSSPLPSLQADDITRQGCPQSAFTSSNSSRRNIPATHNQNYQAPSPTQQPTPPSKWKLKPRAFSLCEEGADKQMQPWFLEEGTGVREAMHGWGGLMVIQLSTPSPLLAYLCTEYVYKGLWLLTGGMTGTGSFCSGSDQEMQPLADATVASPTLL